MKNYLQVNRALAAEKNFNFLSNLYAKVLQNAGGGASQYCVSQSEGAQGKNLDEKAQLSPSCPLLASYLPLTCPLQLRRIALILCVLVMSVGQMWGETATSAVAGTYSVVYSSSPIGGEKKFKEIATNAVYLYRNSSWSYSNNNGVKATSGNNSGIVFYISSPMSLSATISQKATTAETVTVYVKSVSSAFFQELVDGSDNNTTASTNPELGDVGSFTIAGSTTIQTYTDSYASALSAGYYYVYATSSASSVNTYLQSITLATSSWKLKGDFDSWGDGYAMSGSGTVSVTRTLPANSRYEFKFHDGTSYYGNTGAIVHSISGWEYETGKDNGILYTGPAGDYTFSINTSTHVASITYPDVDHPNSNYIYIKKGAGWSDARLYNWEEGSSSTMSDWDGSPILATTTICGTEYWYGAAYWNKLKFRDGGSNQSNELSFDKDATGGGGGKYLDETTHASTWSNFALYTITFAGNGNTGGTMDAIAGLCPGDDPVLPANTFEKTGYDFASWTASASVKVGGSSVTTGIADEATIQDVAANVTLTAQWTPISVSSITVSPSSKKLDVAGTQQLSVEVLPVTALDKEVTWTTSNGSIATVSSTGLVTAVAPGSCTITATAHDGSGVTGTCSITVNKITPTTYNFSADKTIQCGEDDITFTLAGSQVGATYYITKKSDGSTTIGESKAGNGSSISFTVADAKSGDYYCYTSETSTFEKYKVSKSKVTISAGTATSITTQPTNQEVTVGEEATLTVVAAGTSLSYQWKESATEGGTYSDVASDGTSSSYSVTPDAAGTKWFKCEVTGTCGTVTTEARKIVATAAKITPTVTWTTVPSTVYKGGKYAIEVSTNTDASLVAGSLTCTNGTLSGVAVSDGVFTGYLEIATNASSAPTLTLTTSAGSTYAAKTETNDDIELGSCEGGGGSTIYSYTITSTSNVTGGSATGGSVDINGLDDGATAIDEVDYYKIGGDFSLSKRYIKITLSGTTLAAGDVITLFDAVTSDDKGTFILYDSEGTSRHTYGNISTKDEVTEQKYTVTAGDGLVGSSVFYIGRNGSNGRIRTITITRPGGGSSQTTNLTWSGGLVDEGSVDKTVGDANFTYTASSNNSNGAISYSSGTTSVATINSSTGEVTIESAGSTTITATIAESGCYPTKSITYTLTVTASCTSVAAPTALTCSAHTSSSLIFTWTKADHASTYTAKLYSDAECTSQVASQDLGDVATVTFSTLTAEMTYYCKIQSHGDGSTYCADGGTTGAQNGTTDAVPVGHTVTYEYNGATSGASPTSATGASVTLPTPTRAGYEMDGWYKTDGTKVSSPYTPTADITLYARWQKACDAGAGSVATFNFNAGNSTGLTIETNGANATYSVVNSKTNNIPVLDSYFLASSFKNDASGIITITTDATYTDIDSIKLNSAATDNANPKIAIFTVSGETETNQQSAFALSSGSVKTWRATPYKKDLSSKKPDGKVRFKLTTGGSGKSAGLDNIQIFYGGGSGTCYHVYYHGNGAESGFVSDTTSYADDAKATVLGYNDSRYPLTKDGYDFQGWATSADGAVAYTAGEKITIDGADVHLYAKWATASTALVTWKMKTANDEAWATTTGTGTTDETNITSISTAHDEGDNKAKNSATAKTAMASGEVSSTAAPDKSARFTFTIAGGKQVEINKFDCKVFNVSDGNRTYKAQISDAAGNVYNSTNTVPVTASATLTDASFVFGSGKILRGAVTIRIYAWKTSGSPTEFRMGPDVKFYGTVEDYACATPSAPTINGVSEYVPGQTITLTASHDGENYDNLTTYTWYKGTDWATALDNTPVQAAATGESGYTLTIADCTTGNAGLYWCEAANGTCVAHSAAGYDVTVFPAYTITYNLNGGELDGTQKTSYTRFDEDYTLPTPTKTDYVFAGWYGASDFSGLPTVVLGAGSVGDKEYWAKWGSAVTATWTVTKVEDKLYRGGGDYSVKAVIDQMAWNESYKDQLELTATEGVTLKNIVASVVSSHVQVTADFDITTGLAADATEITFTLSVPADGTYAPAELTHDEDLSTCVGSPTIISIFDGTSDTENPNSSTNNKYKQSTQFTNATTGFKYELHGIKGNLIDISEATYTGRGEYTRAIQWGGASTSYYAEFIVPTGYTASITITYVLTSNSPKYIGFGTTKAAQTNGSNYDINETISSNNVVGTSTFSSLSSGTYYYVCSGATSFYILGVSATLTPSSGGITPTLSWDPELNTDEDWKPANTRLEKETGDVDFTFVAVQDKNSLGTITYSSNNTAVATVNAAGTVHIVGAAGDATITATLAASGCFEEATATYNIYVEDNCIDEPGTISTEDLGCDGIKMTVSGHTTSGETVSYQWYKNGVSLAPAAQEATYTTSAAGEYYVIVTNTGTDHCAMASTNTVTVEAKTAISVPTNIVDSWYVKNGRRTPDIALWKTTGVSTFTVKNNDGGATIENIGGCTFELKDGIIYLKGTTSTGAAPSGMEAGDLVIKVEVKDECGSNTKTSSTITIHRQAATTYKEIAFVADGGKGMKKDSITVGHGDGTELYEYLDSVGTAAGNRLFQLSERNIYWTTDEKAIREEYSQFDGILITDDPSTNTVVKTGDDYKTKGYVNAFGTMVDVRPIFTMEAYVSALNNWGSKGIKGNPQSPNPRQYEMRLECKDHEIYGAGLPTPEDGTNVWEEVIDGEIFRHVILVDSMKGVYKGVAYNAETAGDKKPALQGFTGEAAGSLLGLGRILEGTLQAAIERQEEPAARLLVMGINAKALQPTCALTNEGKTVIKNILVYLLKTNMEEVDDCSNYFTGKNSSDWNNASNWSKNQLPSSEAKVRILAPCVISGIQPHVLQVSIVNSGNSNIRYTATSNAACNGTLTINADGALIADGKVRSAVAPHFAANDLMPTTPEMLTINTGSDAQAALIFNNEEGLTKATVNYYSRGRKSDNVYQFQYFAVPMEYVDVNPAFAGSGIYTYAWHENGGWERRGYYTELYAFEGLGITTKFADPRTYTMKGTLASTAEREVTLSNDAAEGAAGKGDNIIGNSWMAPINIASLKTAIGDDSNIEKAVYIYCTGNDKADGDEDVDAGSTETSGQWLAIPIDASGWSGWEGLKVIPAMQAFLIHVTGESSLTLNYDSLVRSTATDKLNEKLRAPRRKAASENAFSGIRMSVADSQTHTDLYLFEGEQFSADYDNGWEAKYMEGDGRSAQFYAMNGEDKMAVMATDELEGTYVGFAPGKESNYTISFFGGEGTYYLNDLKEEKSTLIEQGNTYSFIYEAGDMPHRFLISTTPFGIPSVTTGVGTVEAQEKVQKVIYNDHVYIIRGGKIYDVMGKMMK